MKDSIWNDKKFSVLSRIILIGLWVIFAEIINNEVVFPTIGSTITNLINILKGPNFLYIIMHSLLRSLSGFLISLSLAITMGILSSIFKLVNSLMSPILNFLSSIPTMAIIILALIWLDHDFAPLFVGFLMVFPILYETVLNAILNVDRDMIEMAKMYKVDKVDIIKDIYIPIIFLNLNQVLISALGTNLKMVIAGEALSQPKYAIGSNLQLEKMYLNTSGVFAWIIIILIISKLLEYLAKYIRNIFCTDKWK